MSICSVSAPRAERLTPRELEDGLLRGTRGDRGSRLRPIGLDLVRGPMSQASETTKPRSRRRIASVPPQERVCEMPYDEEAVRELIAVEEGFLTANHGNGPIFLRW